MNFNGAEWLVLMALVLAMLVSAIVSIARSAANSTTKVLWVLVVLLFPVVGPILWYLVGRRSVRTEH